MCEGQLLDPQFTIKYDNIVWVIPPCDLVLNKPAKEPWSPGTNLHKQYGVYFEFDKFLIR